MAVSMDDETLSTLQEEVLKKCSNDKPVNILVTGKTGAGKSTLINGLIGLGQVARVGKELEGVTRDVTSYPREINGVQFNIWDAPGLQDTTESDDVTLDDITAKLEQDLEGTDIHLLLYCHRMDTDRLHSSDELVFKSLIKRFGPKIWETSVIALTFANKVDPPEFDEIKDEESKREEVQEYFKQRPIEYKNKIVDILKKNGMDEQKASEIAVIPTGYYKKTDKIPNPYKVLDIEDWFNPFWIACAERMKETALVPLLMSQMGRIELVGESNTQSYVGDQESHKRPVLIDENSGFWKTTLSALMSLLHWPGRFIRSLFTRANSSYQHINLHIPIEEETRFENIEFVYTTAV